MQRARHFGQKGLEIAVAKTGPIQTRLFCVGWCLVRQHEQCPCFEFQKLARASFTDHFAQEFGRKQPVNSCIRHKLRHSGLYAEQNKIKLFFACFDRTSSNNFQHLLKYNPFACSLIFCPFFKLQHWRDFSLDTKFRLSACCGMLFSRRQP